MAEEAFAVSDNGEMAELEALFANAMPRFHEGLAEVNRELVTRAVEDARADFYPTVPGRRHPRKRPGDGSVRRSRDSIRAIVSGDEARITAGGSSAPAFFGHEFGGGGRPRTRQFPDFRGRTGYVLYPAIRRRRDEAEPEWETLAEKVFTED